jgi:hypothetical protein
MRLVPPQEGCRLEERGDFLQGEWPQKLRARVSESEGMDTHWGNGHE